MGALYQVLGQRRCQGIYNPINLSSDLSFLRNRLCAIKLCGCNFRNEVTKTSRVVPKGSIITLQERRAFLVFTRRYNHTTGMKSFPRVHKEEGKFNHFFINFAFKLMHGVLKEDVIVPHMIVHKDKLGHSPSRDHLFKRCYSKKNDTPNGDLTREVMVCIK